MSDLGLMLWTAILIGIAASPLVPVVLMFLHAARTPAWVWAFTDHSQVIWVASLLFGVVVTPLGLALAAWYWFRLRPELNAVEEGRVTS